MSPQPENSLVFVFYLLTNIIAIFLLYRLFTINNFIIKFVQSITDCNIDV